MYTVKATAARVSPMTRGKGLGNEYYKKVQRMLTDDGLCQLLLSLRTFTKLSVQFLIFVVNLCVSLIRLAIGTTNFVFNYIK